MTSENFQLVPVALCLILAGYIPPEDDCLDPLIAVSEEIYADIVIHAVRRCF